jgi:hypothetical protein
MTSVQVLKAHDIPDREPIEFVPGDQVMVGDRDSEWPGFVFVTSDEGSGWVPGRYLSAGAGPADVVVPYNTRELPTLIGQVLEVVEEDIESGWIWCRSSSGAEGWVPIDTVIERA